jgi:hypothetical protein
MRKHRICLSLGVLLTSLSGSGSVAAFAQEYRGTMEQQMACTPDVFRFCGAAIPDANRIVACLQQNTPQLSAGCRAVFESSDSVANAPAPYPRQSVPPAPRGYQYQYKYQ